MKVPRWVVLLALSVLMLIAVSVFAGSGKRRGEE